MTGYQSRYPDQFPPSGDPPGARPYLDQAQAPAAWPGPDWAPQPAQPAESAMPTPLGLAPRPFLLTQGRTRGASPAINIETQVVATGQGLAAYGYSAFERGEIVTLCQDPLSVAEISARLGLHLNVVRVLVSDLYASGHVTAHLPEFDAAHDVDTLRRVIRGLRAIS